MLKNSFFIVVVLIWLSMLSLTGCSGLKKTRTATEKVINTTEKGTRTIITKGDSVVYKPVIKFKDTTITRYHENIVLKTVYDKTGQIQSINCQQKWQKMFEDYIKTQNTKQTEKTTLKERSIKDIYFLYIGIILTILLVVNKIFK